MHACLAAGLGVSVEVETRCLDLLVQAGQARWDGAHYVPQASATVDTRSDPSAAARLRRYWADTGLQRSEDDPTAVLSYTLGTIASTDRERVRDLHRRYFAELRALIADSSPSEAILLANVQLVEFTRTP